MNSRLIATMLLVAALLMHRLALGAAPPDGSDSASALVARQVESRRKALQPFQGMDLEQLRPNDRAAMLGKMGPALTELAAALASDNAQVFTSAVTDLTNGLYRAFPQDPLRDVLLPTLKTPETGSPERMVSQAFIMEYLANRFGPRAKAALPDLLKIVVDDKLPPYLRGKTIDAAAKIGPEDETLVRAFIAAIENPNPKSESGVQDRAALHLGEMGKAAVTAKPALRKLFQRGSWNEDAALEALGKIGRDEPARPLADYLAVLTSLDKSDLDQAAVAFHHVLAAAKPSAKHLLGTPHAEEVIDAEAVKASRPVLLAVVEREKNDIYVRVALRTLAEIGPGSSARAAKTIAYVLQRTGSSEAVNALRRLEPTDAAAIVPLTEAFNKTAPASQSWHISHCLAEKLAQFGKAAKPAVPSVLRALRQFRASPNAGDAYGEQFAAFLSVLIAAGGDENAQRVVIELLDPAGDVMKRSAPQATANYQLHLLLTLASIGLPRAGELRQAGLARVREGLASDLMLVFSAAAKVVAAVPSLTEKEIQPLVPLLARTLAPNFAFQKAHERIGTTWFAAQDRPGPCQALRALAALGKGAREALPAVKTLADRPLQPTRSSYLPEPSINAVIREARLTLQAIE